MSISNASDLPKSARRLYDILMVRDFKLEALIEELSSCKYSPEDINIAACQYVEDCAFDIVHYDSTGEQTPPHQPGEILPGYPSSHMYEALRLLVTFGLDPNYLVNQETSDEMNIMDCLLDIENGYIAADCLALLLRHGGNPNLAVDGERLLDHCTMRIDYGLGDESICLRFDTWVHYWMVLVGYGAKLSGNQEAFHPSKGHDAIDLKNHRDYYYGYIFSDRYPNHEPEICFFRKDTGFEIGRC